MKNNKKALIFATTAYMVSQFNKPNIKILKEMGYDVYVATNFEEPGPMSNKSVNEFKEYLSNMEVEFFQIDIPRNPAMIFSMIKAYIQLRNIMEFNDFSLIHSHSPTGGVIGRVVANKYRKRGLKSIYTAHGFHFYEGAPRVNWLLFYPIEKYLSRLTDVIITINEEDFRLCKKKFKSKRSYKINGMGLDLNKFNSIDDGMSKKIRKELNISQDDYVIVSVGELNENKNQKMLIDAVTNIIKKGQSVKLILVGDGELKEKYNNYIEKLEMSENIKLLGFRNDVALILKASDLAVSTSYREGLPMNLIESMACGLPIIATNCRGNRDLIINNENGYLIDLKNENIVELLALKIEKIKNNNDAERFIENNILKSKLYDLQYVNNKMENIYRSLHQ